MKKIFLIVLILLAWAVPALSEGMGAMELYDEGMEQYDIEEYGKAAEFFQRAGNYSDAKKWAYYCEAIALVMSDKCTEDDLKNAGARFELLEAQSFKDADQWVKYIGARGYEEVSKTSAADIYKTILVYDSYDRYLYCKNKMGILKTRAESLNELESIYDTPADLGAEEYYEIGMDAYYFEEYAMAADCFSAAGNFMNARQWRLFTQAISMVVQDDNLEDAYVIFEMLEALGFENAGDWRTYIDGRDYQANNLKSDALDCYRLIMVYDSFERYIELSGN